MRNRINVLPVRRVHQARIPGEGGALIPIKVGQDYFRAEKYAFYNRWQENADFSPQRLTP
jgi:hypothetical protein